MTSSASSSSSENSTKHKKEKCHSSHSKKRERKHKDHRKSHKKSSRDDNKHKKRKHDDKERRRSKERKESRKYNDDKRSSHDKKRKIVDESSLQKILGTIQNKSPQRKLHKDSYFSHNAHFKLYLYYKKNGTYFEDLSTKESHALFHKFSKEYNDGVLEEIFYRDSIPVELLEDCKLRTTHQYNWKIRTNEVEKSMLDQVKHRVRNETEGSGGGVTNDTTMEFTSTGTKPICTHDKTTRIPKSQEERQQERIANKRLQKHIKTVEDELTGGKPEVGTYARTLQKRKELSNKLHASTKFKEDTMTGIELNDEDIYGSSGNNEFQQALASEKRRNEKREEGKKERLRELEKKEEERRAGMMKMLGLGNLKPGQKIVIQPRND